MKHLASEPKDKGGHFAIFCTMEGDELHFYQNWRGRYYGQMDGEWFSLSQQDMKDETKTFMKIAATLGKFYFKKSFEERYSELFK